MQKINLFINYNCIVFDCLYLSHLLSTFVTTIRKFCFGIYKIDKQILKMEFSAIQLVANVSC